MQKYRLLTNFLILVALAGLILSGWLVGHVLRYSLPALWHPPIPEMELNIKTGFKVEGIRREVVFLGNTGKLIATSVNLEQSLVSGRVMSLLEECASPIYYTSLPAKYRSADGRLVRAGGFDLNLFLIPPD